jgi:hypothetical protein
MYTCVSCIAAQHCQANQGFSIGPLVRVLLLVRTHTADIIYDMLHIDPQGQVHEWECNQTSPMIYFCVF